MVTHDLGKSSYAVACPRSCLFTLGLRFFTRCKLRPWVLCSTDFVIVCVLLSTMGLLTFLARGYLPAIACCQFVDSDHSEPEMLCTVSLLVWLLNVLSEPFLLLSWHFEAVGMIFFYLFLFSLVFILCTSLNWNSPFDHFCWCIILLVRQWWPKKRKKHRNKGKTALGE